MDARRAKLRRAMNALNLQYFAWVSKQQRSNAYESWERGCADYLRYARELREEYADVALAASVPEQAAAVAAVGAKRGVSAALGEGEGGEVGEGMTFGTGDFGILGLGDAVEESYLPKAVPSLETVTQVACGGMHTAALRADGVVLTWGINDEGALGRAASKDVEGSEEAPGEVALPGHAKATKVTAGDSHTLALGDDGTVYGWGTFRNSSGPMGFMVGTKVARAPVALVGPAARPPTDAVVDVVSGVDHVLALTAGGQVLTWGCPEKGRLGRMRKQDADTQDKDEVKALLPQSLTPTALDLGGRVPTAVGAGAFCSFLVCGNEVLAFGLNNYSQLGIELGDGKGVLQEGREVYTPVRVDSLSGKGVAALDGGEHHTLALTKAGRVLAMGRPTYGRLGRPDVDPESDEPVWAPGAVPDVEGAVVVFAGLSTSAAVAGDGRCWTWGSNTSMQLGKSGSAPNADEDEHTPFLLKGGKRMQGKRVTSVSFGGQHSALVAVAGGGGDDANGGGARKRARA